MTLKALDPATGRELAALELTRSLRQLERPALSPDGTLVAIGLNETPGVQVVRYEPGGSR
jgi:hypothetical protein